MSRRCLLRPPSRVVLALATALGLVATGWGSDLADLGPVPQGGLRVVLVRHAQALSNLSPRPDLSPPELDHVTALGREQARAVGQALASLEIDELLSSPAQRAIETTEIVGKALGLEGRVERGVRPLELGRARDGSPLSWQTRQTAWEAGRDPRPPAGESLVDLGERVRDVVQTARGTHAGGTVVLVAHSEVIGAFIGLVQEAPPPDRLDVHVANGSLSVVDADAYGGLTVRFLDHRPDGP